MFYLLYRYMYFIDDHPVNPSIYRAYMDGHKLEKFVFTKLIRPVSLVVDTYKVSSVLLKLLKQIRHVLNLSTSNFIKRSCGIFNVIR